LLPIRPIVVVDDDPDLQEIVAAALQPLHRPCVCLSSGREFLERMDELNPALLILDLLLPEIDGFSVIEQVRENSTFHQLPILVLTGVEEDFVQRAFECGADDYLNKPFRALELVARARRQLQVQRELQHLEQRRHELQTVVDITRSIAAAHDTRGVLFRTVVTLAALTHADRVSIVLVHGESEALVIASSDNQRLDHFPINVADYPELRYVLLHRRPLVVGDAANAPVFPSEERQLLPYSSFAVIPIEDKDRCLGVLFLRAKAPRCFKLERTPLLQTVGHALGAALHQAELLQSLRSERRQSAEALRQVERRMRLFEPYAEFFRNSADGMVVIEPTGRILFANPRARSMAGETRPLEEANVLDFLVESERASAKRLRRSFRRGVYPKNQDFQILSQSGPKILSVNFSQTPSSHNQAGTEPSTFEAAVLLTFRDVTRERSTEQSLRRTTEFLERVIDSSVDAIVSADAKGRLLVFNRAAARIFGYNQADVVEQMNVVKLYPPGGATEVMRKIRSADYGGVDRLEDYQVNMQDSSGRLVPVNISAAMIYDNGRAVGSVGIFTDIREKLRMRAHLRQAQDELREHEKSVAVAQLAGTTAHELNQPLTVVLSYAELLARNLQHDEGLSRSARIIAEQAARMANIVRQIGRITKYETKAYVGNAQILDLDRSTQESDSDPPRR
jgi:PAS domain S-box-containing protein